MGFSQWIREIWQENADMLHRMWNEDVIYEWWQMLLVGLFFWYVLLEFAAHFALSAVALLSSAAFAKEAPKP